MLDVTALLRRMIVNPASCPVNDAKCTHVQLVTIQIM